MTPPLCIDLYCGTSVWSAGWLEMGGWAVGFDIEHQPHHGDVPKGAHLVIQDVTSLHGSQFRNASLILASPPCTEYSYMAMPWSRAKQIAAALRGDTEMGLTIPFPDGYTGSRTIAQLNRLFDTCFRIQREACEAAGRYIPLIVENVRGAQKWVGDAKANFGSYYLWGDVGMVGKRVVAVVAGVPQFRVSVQPIGRELKQPGRNFHFMEKYGIPSPSFHGHANEPSVVVAAELVGSKNNGGSWFNIAHNTESGCGKNPVADSKNRGAQAQKIEGYSDPRRNGGKGAHLTSQRENDGRKQPGISGERDNGKGDKWFQDGAARHESKSNSRKAASAQIARIPLPLAQYIASCFFRPQVQP